MKLSINQGTFVGKERFNFSISSKRCKELGDFLWDWFDSLPKDVQDVVEVITVNPHLRPLATAIVIKFVLSEGVSSGGESKWTTQFTYSFTLPFDDESSVFSYLFNSLESVEKNLNTILFAEIGKEAKVHKKTSTHLENLVASLPK